jgi:hypothetical protein
VTITRGCSAPSLRQSAPRAPSPTARLLAFDPAAAPAEHPGEAVHERERTHRALSALRVLAHVGAGAAIAQGLSVVGWSFATRAFVAVVLAVVLVALVEGMARSIGYGLGTRAFDALRSSSRHDALLRPVVVLGSRSSVRFSECSPRAAGRWRPNTRRAVSRGRRRGGGRLERREAPTSSR